MDNLKAYLSFVFLWVFFLSSHVLAYHELPQERKTEYNLKVQKRKDSINDWVYPSIGYNPTTTTTTPPPEAAIDGWSKYIEMENNDEDAGGVLWHRKMMKPSKTETNSFKVSSAEPPIIDPRGAKEGSYYGHVLRAEPPEGDGEGVYSSKAGGYYGHLLRAEPPDEDDGGEEDLKLDHVHGSSAEPLVDPRGAKEGYFGNLIGAEPPDEDPRDAKERRVKGKSVVYSRGDDDDEGEVTYAYSTSRADSLPDEDPRDSKVGYGVLNMNEKVDKETIKN
ncbi:uncharacterized protein LOC107610142 isoform X1 [Arachis ipaensis]|uniref:uncharacterized protein LOC107610142 isoform X1 n=1 Tax=Arachis ipaensis TaxID=130454 RepID=UPI0007AFCECD|nr:uncharacterized protein LOC107610142 isoform X1 [Arachis ipaensis]XP_025668887.1 uncharacterized protein LOC112767216 isoform X1 [Arachis hypogaea]